MYDDFSSNSLKPKKALINTYNILNYITSAHFQDGPGLVLQKYLFSIEKIKCNYTINELKVQTIFYGVKKNMLEDVVDPIPSFQVLKTQAKQFKKNNGTAINYNKCSEILIYSKATNDRK